MIKIQRWVLLLALLSGCQAHKTLAPVQEFSLAVPPSTISVRIKNYKPQNGKSFQNLFVSNFSVKIKNGQMNMSTSRDSMPDTLKDQLAANYGFSHSMPESVVQGFADLFLFNAGLKLPQQPLLFCSGNQVQSASNDAFIYHDDRMAGNPVQMLGLRDCEKSYMGLDIMSFANDGNGIPDYMALRCGLNPANKYDAFVSSAADGVTNIDKCKRNIPIDESADSDANKLFSYNYQTNLNPDGSKDFIVSNIPIWTNGIENFIAFYVTETDNSNKAGALYTAFMVLRKDYTGQTIQFNYWGTDPAHYYDQEIIAP